MNFGKEFKETRHFYKDDKENGFNLTYKRGKLWRNLKWFVPTFTLERPLGPQGRTWTGWKQKQSGMVAVWKIKGEIIKP